MSQCATTVNPLLLAIAEAGPREERVRKLNRKTNRLPAGAASEVDPGDAITPSSGDLQ